MPLFSYLYNGTDQASILDLLEGIPGRGLHRSGCEEVWLLNTRTQPSVEVTHNSVPVRTEFWGRGWGEAQVKNKTVLKALSALGRRGGSGAESLRTKPGDLSLTPGTHMDETEH